jgi:cell division cycle 2-like protein
LTGVIVALKKLKLEKEKNGFPITSLREIHTLILSRHRHIVGVLEILVNPDAKPAYVSILSNTRFYIAMEFVEHDLKALMKNMASPFLQSEVKTIMSQLLDGMEISYFRRFVYAQEVDST